MEASLSHLIFAARQSRRERRSPNRQTRRETQKRGLATFEYIADSDMGGGGGVCDGIRNLFKFVGGDGVNGTLGDDGLVGALSFHRGCCRSGGVSQGKKMGQNVSRLQARTKGHVLDTNKAHQTFAVHLESQTCTTKKM
jgi:hypothetical protein